MRLRVRTFNQIEIFNVIMKVLLAFISIIIILTSCGKQEQQVINDPESLKDEITPGKPIVENHEKLTYSTDCNCGNGNLTVNTEYYNVEDTLNSYNYIILNQELVFTIDQKVVKKIKPPYRQLKRIINNQLISVPITDIYSVKCIEKDNQYAYKLYGANLYDPPHEFFSLNDLEGNWLSYFYGDRYEVYESFGSDEPYIKKFGEHVIRLNDMIKVVPDLL